MEKRRSSRTGSSGSSGRNVYGSGNDDYYEKNSKIQRDSRSFITRAVVIVSAITIFALAMGIINQQPKLALNSNVNFRSAAEMSGVTITAGGGSLDDDENETSITKHKGNLNMYKEETETKKTFQDIDKELAETVEVLDKKVRARKATGVIMETDKEGMKLTGELQKATTMLLEHRYGANTRHTKFRVVVNLMFPKSVIKDPDSEGNEGSFTIELAPIEFIPCSVFYFMEIVRTYKTGKFHRNAGHVLQAEASSQATAGHKSMPFQEYSPNFPHEKYTTGYAGRPSGPGWYVSIQNNTRNHGPGSQQKKNPYEADSNFGRVIQESINSGVIDKIHSVPQTGWLSKENCFKIHKLTLLANSINDPDTFTEWKMPK